MKIVEPSYEILDRRGMNAKQKIEVCRLAYKSEDKITEDSADDFFNKMEKNKHLPTIEFANTHVYIKAYIGDKSSFSCWINFYLNFVNCKYLTISEVSREKDYAILVISGTIRAFSEFFVPDLCTAKSPAYNEIFHAMYDELTKHKGIFPCNVQLFEEHKESEGLEVRIINKEEVINLLPLGIFPDYSSHLMCAVKFIVNRAVTHELVRHRPASWIQESQRYCRYSEDKFGSEVTFISPSAFYKEILNIEDQNEELNIWTESCRQSEQAYFKLLKTSSPQAARTVLPNSCKTEIVCYCTIKEWMHIFSMRCSPAAEPSMRQVMIPLEEEFFLEKNINLWE
jgi:thymidylate synthase (FAD)